MDNMENSIIYQFYNMEAVLEMDSVFDGFSPLAEAATVFE
jgi:hypothetical protein